MDAERRQGQTDQTFPLTVYILAYTYAYTSYVNEGQIMGQC